MNKVVKCQGCKRDILPLCKSETGTRHYSCSTCGAKFVTRTNATVVWSEDRGFHDNGERVNVSVDERGRLVTR